MKKESNATNNNPFFGSMKRVIQDPMGLCGLIILLSIIFISIFADFVSPYDPNEQFSGFELVPPGESFPLGTDELGRDIFSRIIFGSRISLSVSILSVSIGAIFGVITGLISGYFGGWVDSVFMRLWDIILAFPGIIIGITIVIVLGTGMFNVSLALGIMNIPIFSRLTRASILKEKQNEYVLAALSIGSSNSRIIFHHLFPNIIGIILVQISLTMGTAILLESTLSFLGLGVQPPDPSWGVMLKNSRSYLTIAPLYGIAPGVLLTLLLIGLNFLSDSLSKALDPYGLTKS